MYMVNPEDIPEPIFEFLSIKDPHLNFGFMNKLRYSHHDDLLAKHQFVREYALTNKISSIFFTGDLVDSNDEKKWSFTQYLANKTELLKYKESGLNLFSIAGNHDMFNGLEKTENTVFHELTLAGIVEYITPRNLNIPFVIDGVEKNILIFGVDYSKHKEVVEKALEQVNNFELNKGNVIKIVFLHSHVTPAEIASTDFTYEYLNKTYRDIDLFICGHYHAGFPTQGYYKKDEEGKDDTSGHTVFVNNWSFQRLVRDYYNELDTHTPEMERIKIGWSHSYNTIVISCTKVSIPYKKYEDAFKPKAVELLKLTKRETFEFFKKINFEDIPVGLEDTEVIKMLAEKQEIGDDIIFLTLQYLNNVVCDNNE